MHTNHFVAKKCGLFSSVFKIITPNNTTPTFQDGIRTSQGIALTITKLIDFYSQGIFYFFCLPLFSIEVNPNINS